MSSQKLITKKGSTTPFIILGLAMLAMITGGLIYFQKIDSTPVADVSQPPVPSAPESQTGVLRLGFIVDEDGVDANIKEFTPFLNYLVAQLKAEGINRGELVPLTTVSDMAIQVRAGTVDIYIDSAFPVMAVNRLAESQLIADRWKGGAESYHTIIFTKNDSGIKSIDDLKGKIIAFDSKTSTVGYFLPKAFLTQKGYKLSEKKSMSDYVAPDEIGYVFVGAQVYDDAYNHVSAAGAESELEVRSHFGDTKMKDLRILLSTPDLPRFLVTVRKDLDQQIKDALPKILFSMDQSPEGSAVLKTFSDTAKFTPLSDGDASLDVLRKLTDLIDEEIIRQ